MRPSLGGDLKWCGATMNNNIGKLTASSHTWAWGNWTVSSVKYNMGEFKGVHRVTQH